jgi:hypothetical protein
VLQTAVLSLVPHLIASEVAAFAVADGSGAEVCALLLGIYNCEVRNLSRGSDAAGPSRDARSMSTSTMGINNFMTMYSNEFQGGADVASQLSEHTLKNHSNFLSVCASPAASLPTINRFKKHSHQSLRVPKSLFVGIRTHCAPPWLAVPMAP